MAQAGLDLATSHSWPILLTQPACSTPHKHQTFAYYGAHSLGSLAFFSHSGNTVPSLSAIHDFRNAKATER